MFPLLPSERHYIVVGTCRQLNTDTNGSTRSAAVLNVESNRLFVRSWVGRAGNKQAFPVLLCHFDSGIAREWYNRGMPGSKKKNPLRPSYEEGELRDKSIEKKQRASFQPKDLLRLIKKEVETPPEGD
ncbi:MAG: hypothetical protein BZY75_01900 [SAR202 cluster bacterium Io17-Chloro-G7]|nr:MAG: hypothetical protein BZY75_01900 [SAR202 cluster bacterium Io17-Chloro-G7]